MQRLRHWGRRKRQADVPHFAPEIVQLATFAIGDLRSALQFAQWALHEAPREGAAVKKLYQLLPETWLAWPSVGPREWLTLHLRPTEAERLISVLGEWSPTDRLVLGLHLLLGVPCEQIGQWVPLPGGGERVVELLGHVAHAMGFSTRYELTTACEAVADTLLDAHDPALGRVARLHFLGCAACRDHASGLQQARKLVLATIALLFRRVDWAPSYLATLPYQPPVRQPSALQRIVRRTALVVALIVLGFVLGQRPAPASTINASASGATSVQVTAAQVIERALKRWEHGPTREFSYERYRARSGQDTVIIERWYEWAAPHRLGVNVRRADGTPLLAVTRNGRSHLSYRIHAGRYTRALQVEHTGVATLTPLLLQLPHVGGIGSFPANGEYWDQTLLWAAQQGKPRLLGTTTFRERKAVRVAFTMPNGDGMYLIIDQATSALLQATRTVSDTQQSEHVWEAEVVQLQRGIPVDPAPLPTELSDSLPNPRQLLLATPPSNVDVQTVLTRKMPFAVPQQLPGPLIAAYLRDLNNRSLEVAQLYEGTDWSLLVASPRISYNIPFRILDQQLGTTAYAVVANTGPQPFSQIEWQLADGSRGVASLWQGGVDETRRLALLKEIVGSLTPVTAQNAATWQAHFVLPDQQ